MYLQDDTLVLEAMVTYTRHDRRQVTVPAVTIFRLTHESTNGGGSGGGTRPFADQCRIYVDLTPLYAPAA
jgi:hypothetical protein